MQKSTQSFPEVPDQTVGRSINYSLAFRIFTKILSTALTEIFDNIRKLYRFKDPCQLLAAHIEFYSETSLEATSRYIKAENFTVKLFPSYTPTIWINLGSPYFLKNGHHEQRINEATDVLLLRNEIIERNNRPTDNIFTIKFLPGAFESFFGFSQTLIGSEIINVNEILPESFMKRLKSAACFEDRIGMLENLFLEKMRMQSRDNYHFTRVKEVIESFCKTGMVSSNRELGGQLYISEKSLNRYFHQVIGTNPKNYLATVRVRTALTAYVRDTANYSPWNHGYCDMSHFYKAVVKFTGQKLPPARHA
jgi:AraC-like DNA-binding protein